MLSKSFSALLRYKTVCTALNFLGVHQGLILTIQGHSKVLPLAEMRHLDKLHIAFVQEFEIESPGKVQEKDNFMGSTAFKLRN